MAASILRFLDVEGAMIEVGSDSVVIGEVRIYGGVEK